MITTPFASDLPALLTPLFTSQWLFYLLEHEIQGNQTRFPELLTALVPEVHQTNRERTTRLRFLGASVIRSDSGWLQRVGPAVEVL